jgi:two-component system, cell cycle response regulator DivK
MTENAALRGRTRAPLVLVVDDAEDTRAFYVEYLRDAGIRAEEARDGSDALEKARELHPTLIVMDMSMPGLDGIEATRLLKDDESTSNISIIALTGHGEQELRERAAAAGVDLFLTKPCLPLELLLHVKGCFTRLRERSS